MTETLIRFCGCCCLLVLVSACTNQPHNAADLILTAEKIYTVDDKNPIVQAVAIKDGKILSLGTNVEVEKFQDAKTKQIDVGDMTIFPGLIESHAHIMGLGYSKLNVDLNQVKSYEELVEKVASAVKASKPGEWILGRGWHQDKWDTPPEPMVLGYQTHEALSKVSPDNPVYLRHASGHAAFVNAKAMEIAELSGDEEIGGEGEIIMDDEGNPTGVLVENAEAIVARHIPDETSDRRRRALKFAIQECLENGITSFQDAGSDSIDIALYRQMLADGELDINLWVMLSGRDRELLSQWFERGPDIHPEGRLTIRALKLYADGALGSRGAWLLRAYADRSNHFGHAVMDMEELFMVVKEGVRHGFQVCTHAIGDRANREALDAYERALGEEGKLDSDHRLRIEHAQHLTEEDIPRFAELGVIPSMQAIHMSSDRPWAIDRLGKERIEEGAYVWQKLIQAGSRVINGTDAPVEPVSPLASFYASVSRKTLKGMPESGYEASQKMSREQALRSYTIDAAYGAFEEALKGSIEVGKRADFTILDRDIMTISEDQILTTKVMMTIVGGEVNYQREL